MNLFKVRRAELPSVLTTLLLSFSVGTPRAFTFTVANTLFLEHLGPAQLPWAYAMSAPVVASLGIAYVAVESRAGLRVAGHTATGALAALLFVAFVALSWGFPEAPIAFALLVLTEAEFTLTNVTFWNVANRLFTVRQAARLFGLVSAGQSFPAVISGLVIPLLVPRISLHGLLLVSVLGHLGTTLLLRWGLHALSEKPRSSRERTEPLPHKVVELLKSPYLRIVAGLLCAQVLLFFAVDNAFYFAVNGQILRTEAVATFLARFLTAVGVLGLAFQALISSRWRQWLGLRSALVSTPATLAVLAALALVAGAVGASPWAVFGLVVILKLWERVSVEAVHSPSYYSLFLPLPPEERSAAQSTLESVVAQAATLVSGGLLVVLDRALGLGLDGLLGVCLVFAGLWVACGLAVAVAYREALRSTLAARRVEPGRLPVADATTLDLLLEGAQSPEPTRALRSLEIIEELDTAALDQVAAALLERRNDDRIVQAAARILERHPRARNAPAILRALEVSWDDTTKARLLRAYGACARQASVATLIRSLRSEGEVKAAAATALLRYASAPGRRAGRAAVESLVDAPNSTSRVLAARIIGASEQGFLVDALERLLTDSDAEVRRHALWAVGRVPRADGVLPYVLRALEEPGLAGEAVRSLVRVGEPALALIAPRLKERAPSPDSLFVRRSLLKAVAAIPARRARTLLFDSLSDPGLRQVALRGLESGGPIDKPSERERLEALLEEELSIQPPRASAAGPPMLHRAAAEDLLEHQDRLLLLLALLFEREALREARRHRSPAGEPDALALELVEAALPESMAARVLPHLERSPAQDRPIAPQSPKATLLAPASGPSAALSQPWSVSLRRWPLEGEPGQVAARLGEIPLFRRLRVEHVVRLAAQRPVERLAAGTSLIKDYPSAVTVLLAGEATGPQAPLGVLPSDLELVRPAEGPSLATATTPVALIRLDGESLRGLFRDAPDAAWRILEHLCQRARGLPEVDVAPPEPRPSGQDLPLSELLPRLVELERVPVFARVPAATLVSVARSANVLELGAGEQIIQQGALDHTLYVLTMGAVDIVKDGTTIARLVAPSLLGELAAILPAPRNATVVTTLPSRALALPREALYALTFEDPGVVELLLDLVVHRIDDTPGAAPRRSPFGLTVEDSLT